MNCCSLSFILTEGGFPLVFPSKMDKTLSFLSLFQLPSLFVFSSSFLVLVL